MPTDSALTTLPDAAQAHALGEAMEAMSAAPAGVGVFELEDGSGLWEVGGYFTAPPDEVELMLLAGAHGARPFAVSELPEIDWVAKVRRELTPVEAGRFFVYGSHDADKLPADRVGLLIEAAMAFGTGHHGTTKGCLLAFERLLGDGHAPVRIADIGCGTAVLAMAAAHVLPTAEVIASDIDAVAVDVARANLAANRLADRIACVEAEGFAHPSLAAAAPFDLIFANILKAPLIALAPDMARHTARGGHVILSGVLERQADELRAAYAAAGFTPLAEEHLEGWVSLTLRRAG